MTDIDTNKIKQNKRVTIKIGSNVLTRSDATLDTTRVSSIVDQVCRLYENGFEVVIITSGAVACGRGELSGKMLPRLDDVSRRQLFSAVGQVKLINRYSDLFRDRGICVGQVLTMKENFSTRRHYLNQRNCMLVMLEAGILPIINENDTVSVTELMFTDNDELSGLVATMLDCQTLLILSNIDGIYDGNPNDSKSKVIAEVPQGTDISSYIQSARSGHGRGGMLTKYRIAKKVSDEGVEVVIANGKRPHIITDLLLGEHDAPCTRFKPAPVSPSPMKRWIAHSDGFVKGEIRLNNKAISVMTSGRASSILPVGVIAVIGEFEKDDLITISNQEGDAIGIGRTTYSSEEARQVIGRHGMRPIIHYDYLYCYES